MKGRAAVILAGGLSMTPEVARKACESSAFVIAINNSWALAPAADALLAADAAWWLSDESPREEQFLGERLVCQRSPNTCASYVEPEKIGSGSNSALQAAYLLTRRGFDPIALCGVDLRDDERTHWHGDHGLGLRNPCRQTFPLARDQWRKFAMRVGRPEVFNCSPRSAVDFFPNVALAEVLGAAP